MNLQASYLYEIKLHYIMKYLHEGLRNGYLVIALSLMAISEALGSSVVIYFFNEVESLALIVISTKELSAQLNGFSMFSLRVGIIPELFS